MPSLLYVLKTERLRFRRYSVSDRELLAPVFSDAYAAQFYPSMQDQAGVDRWINWNLKNYDEYGFGLWAIELLCDGTFIGDAGIIYQTVESQRILEIGWHVHPDFRARGNATEAGQACLKYGFDVLGASELSSIVNPANVASQKVASRVHSQRRSYEGNIGQMLLYYTSATSAA